MIVIFLEDFARLGASFLNLGHGLTRYHRYIYLQDFARQGHFNLVNLFQGLIRYDSYIFRRFRQAGCLLFVQFKTWFN